MGDWKTQAQRTGIKHVKETHCIENKDSRFDKIPWAINSQWRSATHSFGLFWLDPQPYPHTTNEKRYVKYVSQIIACRTICLTSTEAHALKMARHWMVVLCNCTPPCCAVSEKRYLLIILTPRIVGGRPFQDVPSPPFWCIPDKTCVLQVLYLTDRHGYVSLGRILFLSCVPWQMFLPITFWMPRGCGTDMLLQSVLTGQHEDRSKNWHLKIESQNSLTGKSRGSPSFCRWKLSDCPRKIVNIRGSSGPHKSRGSPSPSFTRPFFCKQCTWKPVESSVDFWLIKHHKTPTSLQMGGLLIKSLH